MADRPTDVSGLLEAWGKGDAQARDEFTPLMDRELRRRAEVLSISRSTVTREWQAARTRLYRRMTAPTAQGGPC
jgi:hypothetical protein